MSTKINLLPDVRLTKLRDQSHRRLAVSGMTGAIIITAALLVIGFLVVQGQNITISSLTNGIKSRQNKVSSYPNIKTILSLQARLASLPELYSQRAIMTKVYGILSSVEPSDVAFTNVSLDATNQLTIQATGHSYLGAARITDALEQSNLTVGASASPSNLAHFTNVQLSAVTLSDGVTSFSITASVSPGATHGQ